MQPRQEPGRQDARTVERGSAGRPQRHGSESGRVRANVGLTAGLLCDSMHKQQACREAVCLCVHAHSPESVSNSKIILCQSEVSRALGGLMGIFTFTRVTPGPQGGGGLCRRSPKGADTNYTHRSCYSATCRQDTAVNDATFGSSHTQTKLL